jgi:hypothetical protein
MVSVAEKSLFAEILSPAGCIGQCRRVCRVRVSHGKSAVNKAKSESLAVRREVVGYWATFRRDRRLTA